jgi:hypothetical protein
MVVVGSEGTILGSMDGVVWNRATAPTTAALADVIRTDTTWVTVGDAGTILTSTDGVTWVTRYQNAAIRLSGIVHAGTAFVAVGGTQANTAVILTSSDAVTWTPRALPPNGFGQFEALTDVTYAADFQMFVAVGPATVLASADAINWQPLGAVGIGGPSSITYGKGYFVAAGGNITISTNTLNWTTALSIFGYNLIKVEFINGTFWAVGSDIIDPENPGIAFQSSDAVNWTRVPIPDVPALSGVFAGANSVFLAGSDGILLQSGSDAIPPTFISGECRLLSTGSYALVIDAPPGKVLQVDGSRDFQTWSTISSLTNAVSRVEVIDPSPQSAPYRFYRASRR